MCPATRTTPTAFAPLVEGGFQAGRSGLGAQPGKYPRAGGGFEGSGWNFVPLLEQEDVEAGFEERVSTAGTDVGDALEAKPRTLHDQPARPHARSKADR